MKAEPNRFDFDDLPLTDEEERAQRGGFSNSDYGMGGIVLLDDQGREVPWTGDGVDAEGYPAPRKKRYVDRKMDDDGKFCLTNYRGRVVERYDTQEEAERRIAELLAESP